MLFALRTRVQDRSGDAASVRVAASCFLSLLFVGLLTVTVVRVGRASAAQQILWARLGREVGFSERRILFGDHTSYRVLFMMRVSTLTGDIISSLFVGGFLGFLYYIIFESVGVTDFVLRKVGLTNLGGRFELGEFVVIGAMLGIILNLVGKFIIGLSGG